MTPIMTWRMSHKALIDWALKRMANRTDACGGYYQKGGKTTLTTHKGFAEVKGKLLAHFSGKACIGLHSASPACHPKATTRFSSYSKWGCCDIDNHASANKTNLRSTITWRNTLQIANRIEDQGFTPYIFSSDGRGGYHVYTFFDRPAETERVYEYLRQVSKGIKCDLFPRQPSVPNGRFGNWLRVPGKHHTRDHWMQLFDRDGHRWLAADSTVDQILRIEGDDPSGLPPLEGRTTVKARDIVTIVPEGVIVPLTDRTCEYLINGATEGERNARLFAAAADCKGANYSMAFARDKLIPRGIMDGLGAEECKITIDSAYGAERTPGVPLDEEDIRLLGSTKTLQERVSEDATNPHVLNTTTPADRVKHTKTKASYKPKKRHLCCNAEEYRYKDDKGKEKTAHTHIPLKRIIAGIQEATGDWPRRVNDLLFFCYEFGDDLNPPIRVLKNPECLFGWLQDQMNVRWESGKVKDIDRKSMLSAITKAEFFQAMCGTIEPSYDAIGGLPHVPEIKSLYYPGTILPKGDGKALAYFMTKWNPDSELDRKLLLSALLTPGWGGPPGARPAFFFTSEHGRGTGKTTTAEVFATIWGGCITLGEREDLSVFRARLLDTSSLTQRICFRDNVKGKLQGSDLEGLMTGKNIDGKKMYVGQFNRPNFLTWFVTANTARLSRDIAERSVIIKIGRGNYAENFRGWAFQWVQENQKALLADLYAILKSDPCCEITHPDRWADWQHGVLSRIPDGGELTKTIIERRGAVDEDIEEALDFTDELHKELAYRGHKPDIDVVRITRREMFKFLVEHSLLKASYGLKGGITFVRECLANGSGKVPVREKRFTKTREWLWTGPQGLGERAIKPAKLRPDPSEGGETWTG